MRGWPRKKRRTKTPHIGNKLALEADPKYFYAQKQLGSCYYYLGKKAEALEAMTPISCQAFWTHRSSRCEWIEETGGDGASAVPSASYIEDYGIRGQWVMDAPLTEGGLATALVGLFDRLVGYWHRNDPTERAAIPGQSGAGLALR